MHAVGRQHPPRRNAHKGLPRNLAVADVCSDPRTRELRGGYLDPHGITSMLDAPIRRGGELLGVVCHEHVGPMRTWTPDEQGFAASIADLSSLAIEIGDQRHAEEGLQRTYDELEACVRTPASWRRPTSACSRAWIGSSPCSSPPCRRSRTCLSRTSPCERTASVLYSYVGRKNGGLFLRLPLRPV